MWMEEQWQGKGSGSPGALLPHEVGKGEHLTRDRASRLHCAPMDGGWGGEGNRGHDHPNSCEGPPLPLVCCLPCLLSPTGPAGPRSAGRLLSPQQGHTAPAICSGCHLHGPHLRRPSVQCARAPSAPRHLTAPLPFISASPSPRTWPTRWWSTTRPTCSTGWRRAWPGSSACGTTRGSEWGPGGWGGVAEARMGRRAGRWSLVNNA